MLAPITTPHKIPFQRVPPPETDCHATQIASATLTTVMAVNPVLLGIHDCRSGFSSFSFFLSFFSTVFFAKSHLAQISAW